MGDILRKYPICAYGKDAFVIILYHSPVIKMFPKFVIQSKTKTAQTKTSLKTINKTTINLMKTIFMKQRKIA